MVSPEKVALFFPTTREAKQWQDELQTVGLQDFFLVFDHTQALTLLQNLDNISVLLAPADLLDKANPSAEEFLAVLDAHSAKTIVIALADYQSPESVASIRDGIGRQVKRKAQTTK